MLKLIVDKLEEVPEAHRSEYTATQDGKFRLNVEGVEDVTGLKNALTAARSERETAQRDLAEMKRLGTKEQITAALDKVRKAEEAEAQARGDFDAQKKQLIEASERAAKKHEEDMSSANRTIEKLTVGREVAEALANAKVKTAKAAIAAHVRAHTKVEYVNGDPVVCVIDDAGVKQIDGQGKSITVADFVEKLRKDPEFAINFESSGAAGGGAGSGAGRGSADAGRGAGAVLEIKSGDQAGINANLEKISKGEAVIVP